MFVLGLTGSIGMGKSTAAAMFRRQGAAVHDADAVVHALLGPGGAAVVPVAAAFDGVVEGVGQTAHIDRKALGAQVFDDGEALTRLEKILHPMVREAEDRFLRLMTRRGDHLVVLDIPLLFETGAQVRCDAVAVVSAPAFVQEARVLSRPGMTPERLADIRARQMPDTEKRRRADFVLPTGLGKATTLRAIGTVVRLVATQAGHTWPPR
ncbi:MAG: dephospho-CoA kinase [Pseudomonadota bacterium]